MLDGMRQRAREERIAILAIKDLYAVDAEVLHPSLAAAGFARAPGLPNVLLDLPFGSESAYLAWLPEKTSSYLRRKMRALSRVKVEFRNTLEGLEREIYALYEETRTNGAADYGDFEKLHPDFFPAVVRECGDRAQFMLCWVEGKLASFQLFMVGRDEVAAKFIGMRYPIAREHNLYFINWMMIIRFCLERGIGRVRMGGTAYSSKLMFGGRLERSWLYFRHRNPVMNHIFSHAARFVDYEASDPDLQRLEQERLRGAGP
jgi:hypothetical protein